MRHADRLDEISGRLFLLGFITTKLKNIPIVFLAVALNIISLTSYLIGYAAWTIATFFYPNHPHKQGHWYSFAQFKDQFKIAALLGTIASAMCIMTPTLAVPIAWLYMMSNLIWIFGEYHKKEHPNPNDLLYSDAKQTIYLKFASLVTCGSTFAAIVTTTLILIPEAAFFLIPFSTAIGSLITLGALYYWGKYAFGTFTPNNKSNNSYVELTHQLSSYPSTSKTDNQQDSKPMVQPISFPPLFQTKELNIERSTTGLNDSSLIKLRDFVIPAKAGIHP
jgi:hypothetical protein